MDGIINVSVNNNRIIIPKVYREELGNRVIYYYDRNTNSIRIYNYDLLSKRLEKVLELNLDRRINRAIFSNMYDANISQGNRLLIDKRTRELLDLENEATIIGCDDHLKLCKKRVKLS